MKEKIIEYHPNGRIKYIIEYYPNGSIGYKQYYNQNGRHHREASLPDYHSWYDNGMLFHKTYCVHGRYHNINNPANIWFRKNGKINDKYYYIKSITYFKLQWENYIKQIK